ncbi:DUF3239 domain-containing protein [Corynebacterium sp. ES2730-CONJ]|uniref:DUF3239 domain-containing protein n=1 Tax=Corynebacterium sp. ES2730-CONJ TaxID=2973941 RepID=UPI00216B2DC8|nr:DUF3239 domain-containing protein [Corynebacterium sp. ES2730-CONJ]MCS4531675.1 DUF3239 domain-containing protein [Corynebacterium sp. ES2730-CONJ]
MQKFSFSVDEQYARKHNELLRDGSRLIKAALLAVVLLISLIFVVDYINLGGYAVVAKIVLGALAAMNAVLVFVLPRAIGSAEKLYNSYELCAAMIAEVNPRDCVLLALVNLSALDTQPPQWALATRTVTGLGDHTRKIGEKVPAVAVSGRKDVYAKDAWGEVSPVPITWGTPDREVIARARAAIPEEQWRVLEENLHRLEDVQATPRNLLELELS